MSSKITKLTKNRYFILLMVFIAVYFLYYLTYKGIGYYLVAHRYTKHISHFASKDLDAVTYKDLSDFLESHNLNLDITLMEPPRDQNAVIDINLYTRWLYKSLQYRLPNPTEEQVEEVTSLLKFDHNCPICRYDKICFLAYYDLLPTDFNKHVIFKGPTRFIDLEQLYNTLSKMGVTNNENL